MKNNIIKKIIIIGIAVMVVGIIIAGVLIMGNDEGEIIDKPLSEVTMDDFKKTKVEIEVLGFDYPEYNIDYKDIYKEYVKTSYPNISVIKASDDTKGNVVSATKENISDIINGKEVLDLKPFIKNEIFGFTSRGENNFGNIYLEYVYGLNEGKIYAIPEYINIPSIIYNNAFSEALDIMIPSKWSDLAIVKSELVNFEDYKEHLVAGYDKEHFDIVAAFVAQGYDEETARYIIKSWENNNILKGYDKTNMDELYGDLPIIFIMPNNDTIKALGKMSSSYSVGGMLLDDEEMLYINCNDGKHGQYLSVIKGDNVYEDIASWLYLKASIDTEYKQQLAIKPFLENNLSTNIQGEYNYIMLQLLNFYEQMYEKDRIVFYNK